MDAPATNLDLGLTENEAAQYQRTSGFNEIPEKRPNQLLAMLRKFWGPSAWMLELIIILSVALDKKTDAYIVLALLLVNAVIGFIQEYNAGNAVEALRKKLQINVKVLRDGIWRSVAARELVPGDVVRMRKGDFVAADIIVKKGTVRVDQSSLTGESAEIEKQISDNIFSGSVITFGEVTGVVIATGANTFYGKTISLVKIAKPKSHIEEVIFQVVRWLLLIVGVFLCVALVTSFFEGINLLEILPLMLVLLLGAIPVALSAMFTVSMALGSRQLVAQGVLVTRLNAPDDAASMDILCVDKTGTLTTNHIAIAELRPAPDYTKNDLLLFGALASQEANQDAIDFAFIENARKENILNPTLTQEKFFPFDASTRRTEAIIRSDNQHFRVMKGAFSVIAKICDLEASTIGTWEQTINDLAARGYRAIAVAKGGLDSKPSFIGLAALHDPPRADSKHMVQELQNLGVSFKMLTGDSKPVATEIARVVGIGSSILSATDLANQNTVDDLLKEVNGVSEVFPEDKFKIVKALQAKGHVVGMTGDGVNDAPALKQAEVGIAVSSATDVAKGAASIILTTEGLSGIIAPIKIGRMMFERINIWILNKLARTVLKTCFIVLSFLVLGKFVISATAMLIMLFMTDFVKIFLSTDHVRFDKKPARWRIKSQVFVGSVLGVLMTAEALSLLFFGLNYFKLSDHGLETYSFQILLFFALFSIIVVREKRFFWSSRPGALLGTVIICDFILAIAISTFGWFGFNAVPLSVTASTLVVTGFSSLVLNDQIKRLLIVKVQKASA